MRYCQHHDCVQDEPRRRRGGILSFLVQIVFVYALMVFGGGTLINTGHPVAMEVGHILQLVTFVEPAIYWAQGAGYENISDGLRMLASGVPESVWT